MTAITSITPEIHRDRFGRPLVIPPGGGKPVAYTRCTTFVDCIEDKFNLQKWQQRMVALGLAGRRDLQMAALAHPNDKRELDRICEQAREAAAASSAATTGTALHALTELIYRGQQLPTGLDDTTKADLDAYTAATSTLKHLSIEQFLVQDPLKVGGTTDRIVKVGKETVIADIKTGGIEYGPLKIAMQLAMYARSKTYDVATGERALHNASIERGLIIHLPAGQGRCELHWIDLMAGWNAVMVARDVREKRKAKFADLTEPFTSAAPAPAVPSLADQIAAAPTAEAVRDLWAAHQGVWDDALTELAARRVASLDGNPAA